MENRCNICPRNCSLPRSGAAGSGVCKMGRNPVVARAALHLWEEPCISGERGSGTVFFSGCSLKCSFCQNAKISREGFGREITVPRLREIFFELISQGAHNINLVNPTHFADAVLEALEGGLPVPAVYNTGGYDKVETLKKFAGKIQIYLPDMKYALSEPAAKYSQAADYPETAKAAILEMFSQVGPYVQGDDGMLKSGVLIRHLILPGNLDNTFQVIDWVKDTFSPGDVFFSLMSQFTPSVHAAGEELGRRLTTDEHEKALEYLMRSGIEDGFYQDLSSAEEEYIPPFDLTGI